MYKFSEEDLLETAVPREFAVSVMSKPGFDPFFAQIMVVKAHSKKEAKLETLKRIKKNKKYQYRRLQDFKFIYVKAANEEEEPENGNVIE